ncbi:hypothetical protein [Paraburkholderia caffeinilytica]|uniref:hypothetical protein n=1 Tax=Paraburkholderia caffeinilytica TaxID=1761016 RepID=UPI0038B75478
MTLLIKLAKARVSGEKTQESAMEGRDVRLLWAMLVCHGRLVHKRELMNGLFAGIPFCVGRLAHKFVIAYGDAQARLPSRSLPQFGAAISVSRVVF